MRLQFFTVPVFGGDAAAAELDRFLASHRVVALDRQLVDQGPGSAWAVCVTYVDGAPAEEGAAAARKAPRIDYREVLSEAQFRLFSKLRALRKEVAEAEGVPVYAVFTNEQLALIVQRDVRTSAALQEIDGIGPARAEKYAARFLAVVRAEGPPSNGAGSHGQA